MFQKRRAFGQHFLKDRQIAQSIAHEAVDRALENRSPAILEIGPGRGAITEPLLELVGSHPEIQNLTLVEKDRDLAGMWLEKSKETSHLKVLCRDFLDVPDTEWLSKTPLTVVSNLPYSTGTRILTRLATYPRGISAMVLMFQAEVAQRIRAETDSADVGSLSIWVQNRWDVTKFISVSPRAFSPPPKVQSEVVVMIPRSQPRIAVENENHWENFLKTCFAHRRKMLRSSIPWQNALEQSGVDGKKRAQALAWEEWNQLYQAVRRTSGEGVGSQS